MRPWLALAAAGILAASPAEAQDVRGPRVEFGGNLSVLAGLGIVVGGGPQVTVNVTRRIAVELLADVIGPVEGSGTTALYIAQLELPITRSRGGHRTWSLTVGAGGGIWYNRFRETRVARPDGSIVVYPAYRQFRAQSPNTISVGVAREQVLGRHASASLALQAVAGGFGGLGVRAAAGVSFGAGRYR
jgi:hypothetical protein